MKKFLSFAMVVVLMLLMCVTFTSCEEEKTIYTVGICGEGLSDDDGVVSSFMDSLRSDLGDESVEFVEKNVKQSKSAYSAAVKEFEEGGIDVIFANGSYALKAVSEATKDIPVIGASVADYATLLDLEDYSGVIGGNVTGINSYPSFDDQFNFIKEIASEAETVAVLYCSEDEGAEYRASQLMETTELEGIGCDVFPFENETDVAEVAKTAADAADVLYIISGEKTVSFSELIKNAITPMTTPVLSDSEELCKTCCAVSIYVSEQAIAEAASRTASRILTEIANIEKIHTGYATEFIRVYNEKLCEEQGIDIVKLEENHFEKIETEEEI